MLVDERLHSNKEDASSEAAGLVAPSVPLGSRDHLCSIETRQCMAVSGLVDTNV